MFMGLKEVNNRMVVHHDDRGSDEVKSNFVFNINREIEAGKRSGYLCTITYFTGEPLGYAYFTMDDVSAGTSKWLKAIQQCVQSTKPQCHYSDKQLRRFLMDKIDTYNEDSRDTTCSRAQAVSVIGLQIPPSWVPTPPPKVWVLNKEIQLDEDGQLVDLTSSPYTWISDVCKKRTELFKPDSATGEISFVDPQRSSSAKAPLDDSALVNLLHALENSYEENFPGVLMMLGGYVLAVHYETVIDEFEKVPATILFGDVQCGKSEATKAALSTTGMMNANFFSHISDSRVFAYSSQTTLGVVLDDPKDVHEVEKKITYHFQRANAATMSYSYKPRTTFITSLNEQPTLHNLAKQSRLITRAALIPLKRIEGRTPTIQDELDTSLKKAMAAASGAVGIMIALGKRLIEDRQELTTVVLPKVMKIIPQCIYRVQFSYSMLIYATFKMLEAVQKRSDYEESVWRFMESAVHDAALKYQTQPTEAGYISVKFSIKDLESLVLKTLEKKGPNEVLTFLRADRMVTAPGDLVPKPCISLFLKGLCVALREAGEYISDDGLRQRLKSLPCKMGLPQWFLKERDSFTYIPSSKALLKDHGKQHKCCQIYRDLFSTDFLKTVDKATKNELYEDSFDEDEDSLTEDGLGEKSDGDDSLDEDGLGEKSRGDDSLDDSGLGEKSHGDDSLTDSGLGEKSHGDDSLTDSGLGEKSHGDDNLAEDGLGEKSDGDDSLDDDGLGEKSHGDDSLAEDGLGEKRLDEKNNGDGSFAEDSLSEKRLFNRLSEKSKNSDDPSNGHASKSATKVKSSRKRVTSPDTIPSPQPIVKRKKVGKTNTLVKQMQVPISGRTRSRAANRSSQESSENCDTNPTNGEKEDNSISLVHTDSGSPLSPILQNKQSKLDHHTLFHIVVQPAPPATTQRLPGNQGRKTTGRKRRK